MQLTRPDFVALLRSQRALLSSSSNSSNTSNNNDDGEERRSWLTGRRHNRVCRNNDVTDIGSTYEAVVASLYNRVSGDVGSGSGSGSGDGGSSRGDDDGDGDGGGGGGGGGSGGVGGGGAWERVMSPYVLRRNAFTM
jgi:hypothetical protein